MQRKQNKKLRSNQRVSMGIIPRYADAMSYAGQPRVRLTLPAQTVLLSTTVTTGVIANSNQISITNIQSFTARFGSTFDEYRIVSAKMLIRPLTVSQGVTVFMWDEQSTTVPSQNDAYERLGKRLVNSNANAKSFQTMSWKARDLKDFNYNPLGTAFTPVTFKTYTDNTAFGAPTAVTQLWLIEPFVTIEFKGLKAV